MVVGRLSESMPEDTKRLILLPLLRPLTRFWGPDGVTPAHPAARRHNPPTKALPISTSDSKTRPSNFPALQAGLAAAAAAAPMTAQMRRVDAGLGSESPLLNSVGVGGQGETGSEQERDSGDLASEEDIGRCVEDLEKLLTAAPAPPALMGLLSEVDVAVPLFRLHCFCKK